MGRKKALPPNHLGRKAYGFRGTTQLRGKTRALVFPITGDDPSAHFLAAAPGRTPQRLTDRLAAGDRSSLGKAMIAELPVQSILNTPFISYSTGTCKGKLQNTQNCRRMSRKKWRAPQRTPFFELILFPPCVSSAFSGAAAPTLRRPAAELRSTEPHSSHRRS